MKTEFKGSKGLIPLSIAVISFFILRFAKVTPIVGAKLAFFSLSDVVIPLAGVYGISFAVWTFALRIFYKSALWGVSFSSFLQYLPGLSASAYFATTSKMIRLFLPLACIAAFLAHPIGFVAAPYTLYWFIPVGLYFFGRKTIFSESLASTFIAHAVGSVLWLYMFNVPAAVWYGLIPVVAVERLFFASTMTVVYTALSTIKGAVLPRISYATKHLGWV